MCIVFTNLVGIIAKMDSLIAGLDLPVVPLSEQQQQELDKQRAIQQQKIKDIKAMGLGFVWYWLVYWWRVLLVYGYQLRYLY
jgi:hypothetical protein